MAVFRNVFFEERVERLFDLAAVVEELFSSAGVEYRVVGGLATYLYVEEVDPDAGRLTKDVHIAIRREDLARIATVARQFGLEHRHVAGVDMLVEASKPSARSAIHLVFAGEKVRPEYVEAAPELGTYRRFRGIRVAPLVDLIRMKLTSFRASDEAHLKDLDDAGLITAEIESQLSPVLAERLARVRARE